MWHRLHISTWFVIALGVGVFTLLNWPGEYDDISRLYSSDDVTLVHGWPATYLERDVIFDDGYGFLTPIEETKFWSLNLDVLDFHPWALLLNCIVACAVIAVVATLWERRRRRLGPWWRFSLRRLFVIVTLCAVVAGWWSIRAREESETLDLIREIGYTNNPSFQIDFDRTLSFRLEHPVLVPHFPGWVRQFIGNERLLPLHINRFVGRFDVNLKESMNLDEVARVINLAPTIVNVWADAAQCRRLEILLKKQPDLRQLRLVCEPELDELKRLRNLRSLELLLCVPKKSGTPATSAEWQPMIAEIIRNNQKLERLELKRHPLDTAACKAIQSLQHLKKLAICRCSFENGGFESCFPLPSLRELEMCGCPMNSLDLSPLSGSPELRSIGLGKLSGNVNWDTLPPLRKLEKAEELKHEPSQSYLVLPVLLDKSKFPSLKKIGP